MTLYYSLKKYNKLSNLAKRDNLMFSKLYGNREFFILLNQTDNPLDVYYRTDRHNTQYCFTGGVNQTYNSTIEVMN